MKLLQIFRSYGTEIALKTRFFDAINLSFEVFIQPY